MLVWIFEAHPDAAKDNLEKILVFEDDFEGEIASWWNEIRGTPTLSAEKAHSGNYSYVTDENEEGLIYWFNSSITNEIWEFEVWFYDNMSDTSTSIIGIGWASGQVLGMLIWYDGDYENFYAYRYGESITPVLGSIPRSVGWHKVNLVHELGKASIFIDEILLVQINESVSFNRFFIGDFWSGFSSYVYYDSIKIWKHIIPIEYSFLTIDKTTGGTTDPASGTYSYPTNTTVQVTAVPSATYTFNHWELDNVNIGSDNPCTILMDRNHTLKAIFTYVPPPLTVYINPITASIRTGSSLTLTLTVRGGLPPYTYQWYLNGNLVRNENGSSWVFKPVEDGLYHIYANVTDSIGSTKKSKIVDVSSQLNYETETITLEAIADAYVVNIGSGSGTENTLEVGFLTLVMWVTYVMFDVSSIPSHARIDSVKFKIKVDSFTIETSNWVSAFTTLSDWIETRVNWTNKPALKTDLGAKQITLLKEWYHWGHPSLINSTREALEHGGNLSIALRSTYTSGDAGWVSFFSRESGDAPQLVITYTLDTSPPILSIIEVQPNMPTSNDAITFIIDVNDSITGVKEVYLHYSTDNGTYWNKIPMISSENLYQATIPKQAEGTIIQYYFEAFDNVDNRVQSDIYSLTVRTIIPPHYYLFHPLVIFGGLAIVLTIIAIRVGAFSKKKKPAQN